MNNGNIKKLIVVNPAAGKASFSAKLDYFNQKLSEASLEYEVIFTEQDSPDRLISYIKSQNCFDEVFVMGGDGTLNMVVNEIGGARLPIAIISNGTGNDSVKSLHGIMDFKKQVEIALSGSVKPFDLGVCNGRYFVNGVGIGFDGEVVRTMLEKGDKRGRHIDYLLTVLRIVGGFKEKKLRYALDGKYHEKKILLFTISNGTTFGGGFVINPKAKTDDGLLDICIFNEIKPWKRFWHLPKLKTGAHTRITEVELHTATSITIEKTEDLVAHLDGEFIGHPPFNISVISHALLLKVPSSHS